MQFGLYVKTAFFAQTLRTRTQTEQIPDKGLLLLLTERNGSMKLADMSAYQQNTVDFHSFFPVTRTVLAMVIMAEVRKLLAATVLILTLLVVQCVGHQPNQYVGPRNS